MSITPAPLAPPLGYTVLDILTDALIEVGMLAPGEMPDGETAQWAFRKINLLLDTWAARKNFVYANTFLTYTLVPNLSPHLIGPDPVTATFTATQRPVKIVRATIILNNVTPNVEVPLTLRDEQWWMEDVTVKDLRSSQPTDLFYSPSYPNGSLYYWPVPATAYGTRLECWVLLGQFASIQDPIGGQNAAQSLPPGYRNALMLTLAETLLSGGEREANPMLTQAAAQARLAIFGNNTPSPRMETRDSGLPGADQTLRQSNFNYKSRSFF
jgi:hypothetical protein